MSTKCRLLSLTVALALVASAPFWGWMLAIPAAAAAVGLDVLARMGDHRDRDRR